MKHADHSDSEDEPVYDDCSSEDDYHEDRRRRKRVYVPKPGVEIFIGGLTRSTRRDMLKDWFGQFGEITEVRIARDKRRRRCRGYGYVRFRTSAQADAAVESMRKFQFKEGRFLGALPSDENRTLFVGNLAESWSADTVKTLLFDAFTGVRSVEPIPDKEDSTKIRSFCFVEFYQHGQASAAHAQYHCEPLLPALAPTLISAVSADDCSGADDRSTRTSDAAASGSDGSADRCLSDSASNSRCSSSAAAAAAWDVQAAELSASSNKELRSCSDGGTTAETSTASPATVTSPTISAGHDAAVTAAVAAAAIAAAPFAAAAAAAGAPADSKLKLSSSSAVPLIVEGVELKVDWADPLRYHIHLHGGIKGPRGDIGGTDDHSGASRTGIAGSWPRYGDLFQPHPGVSGRRNHAHRMQHQPQYHHFTQQQQQHRLYPAAAQQTPPPMYPPPYPQQPRMPLHPSSMLYRNSSSGASSMHQQQQQHSAMSMQQNQQLHPPINRSYSDLDGTAAAQLIWLQQQHQAEHEHYMAARHGVYSPYSMPWTTSPSPHSLSPVAPTTLMPPVPAAASGSGYYYAPPALHVQQQQPLGMPAAGGSNSGGSSPYIGGEEYGWGLGAYDQHQLPLHHNDHSYHHQQQQQQQQYQPPPQQREISSSTSAALASYQAQLAQHKLQQQQAAEAEEAEVRARWEAQHHESAAAAVQSPRTAAGSRRSSIAAITGVDSPRASAVAAAAAADAVTSQHRHQHQQHSALRSIFSPFHRVLSESSGLNALGEASTGSGADAAAAVQDRVGSGSGNTASLSSGFTGAGALSAVSALVGGSGANAYQRRRSSAIMDSQISRGLYEGLLSTSSTHHRRRSSGIMESHIASALYDGGDELPASELSSSIWGRSLTQSAAPSSSLHLQQQQQQQHHNDASGSSSSPPRQPQQQQQCRDFNHN